MRDNKFSKNRKPVNGSAFRSSKFASFFIAFLIIICRFPIVVNADNTLNYSVSENGSIVQTTAGDSIVNGWGSANPEVDIKGFVFRNSDESYMNNKIVFIADAQATVYSGLYQLGSSYFLNFGAYNLVYNETYHKYIYILRNVTIRDIVCPYNVKSNTSSISDADLLQYIFDNMPSETNWGNPADVSISTKYSGNVEKSPSNIDKFTWNNAVDSNGISYMAHITEHPVIEVQAVPITWKTSTREEMENNSGGSAIVGTGVPIDSYNARSGHLEITWQEVINYLQIEYADIYSYFFDGTYWIAKGWFYQIRLVADNYTGEWITLSNGLNLTPKKSKKLIEDPYDETIYNILKEISENNNQTTTVYEYGDTYITINNDPTSGWQGQDGGGSFWDFLASVIKAISDGIASIVSSVASLVGDIIDGVLGLFTFDNFTINNYDTEVQTIKENSGIFGQSIEFADSIKDSIRGVEQQPAVLHFDGIVVDSVQLIPAVDLDFDQMVVDAGLTDFHDLVYVFTDGTILISLIIMVHHKLMEVLRK